MSYCFHSGMNIQESVNQHLPIDCVNVKLLPHYREAHLHAVNASGLLDLYLHHWPQGARVLLSSLFKTSHVLYYCFVCAYGSSTTSFVLSQLQYKIARYPRLGRPSKHPARMKRMIKFLHLLLSFVSGMRYLYVFTS